MRTFRALPALAALAFVFTFGCSGEDDRVDLTQETIREIQVLLPAGVQERGVVPARTYALDLKFVVERDGALVTVDKFFDDQVVVTGAHVSYGDGTLRVSYSNIEAWDAGYRIEISVRDNPFPAKVVELGTDWAGFVGLAYRGRDGWGGRDGRDGPDLTTYVARARAEDGSLWRVLRTQYVDGAGAPVVDLTVTPEAAPFELSSVGGDGDDGSDGSNGGSHATTAAACDGEDGEDGTDAGDGGSITLSYYSPESQVGMVFNSHGGTGGRGGDGGDGGNFCEDGPGRDGRDGRDGSAGVPGRLTPRMTDRSVIEPFFAGLGAYGLTVID